MEDTETRRQWARPPPLVAEVDSLCLFDKITAMIKSFEATGEIIATKFAISRVLAFLAGNYREVEARS